MRSTFHKHKPTDDSPERTSMKLDCCLYFSASQYLYSAKMAYRAKEVTHCIIALGFVEFTNILFDKMLSNGLRTFTEIGYLPVTSDRKGHIISV